MIFRLRQIEVTRLHFPRTRPFKIALRHYTDEAECIAVRVSDETESGLGTAPADPNQSETCEALLPQVMEAARHALDVDFESPHDLLPHLPAGPPSARCALDIALHDFCARRRGRFLMDSLASAFDRVPAASLVADQTIGIDTLEATVSHAAQLVQQGFTALKLKGGLDPEQDLARVKAVREKIGWGIRLVFDANQGLDAETALRVAKSLATLEVAGFEQPVQADDLQALAAVSHGSTVPIFADESAASVAQIEQLGRHRAAAGVVIKILRFGGITGAVDAIKAAQRHGLQVMFGCFVEPAPGLAAALHLAQASGTSLPVDLDGDWLIANSPFERMILEQGHLRGRGPGHGIHLVEPILFEHRLRTY